MRQNIGSLGFATVRGEETYVNRIMDMPITMAEYKDAKEAAEYIGVTEQFKDVIETFHTCLLYTSPSPRDTR